MNKRFLIAAFLVIGPAVAGAASESGSRLASPAPAAAKQDAAPAPSADVTYAYLSRDGATFKAPLFAEESQNLPVAQVDDEAISLEELNKAISGAHGAHAGATVAGKKDPRAILDRLVDVRLLAREAREMGIDELPEFKEAVQSFRLASGRQLLQATAVRGVKADPAEAERIYREAVREWKVRSVLVTKEEDAKAFRAELGAGKKFDDLAKRLVAEKKGKGGEEGQFIGRANALPDVVAALQTLKPGGVSAPLKLKDGFAVMRVEEIRYPDDPKARAEAEQASRSRREKAALERFYAGIVKRYAKTDQALLKRLDFEAKKPGIAALRKDARVLSRIEGAKPITVGELAGAVAESFYHGVDSAIKEKKVNREKLLIFDGLLAARVVPLEVKRLAIEESPEFKKQVAAYENTLLFSKFVEKAIMPDLKITDEQLKKYYAEHKKEFTYPTFYKLESLAFTNLKDAEGAVKKLRSGTDFKWLNANAEGQVKASERKLSLEGTLAATTLPKELERLLAGSKKDDHRLYADDAAKQYYAIHVVDVVGATEQPFDVAKESIGKTLLNDAMTDALRSWSDKLRKARKVTVYLTRIGS